MQSVKQKAESSLSIKRYDAQLRSYLNNEKAKSYSEFLSIDAACREALKSTLLSGKSEFQKEKSLLEEVLERREKFLNGIGLTSADIDEGYYCALCRDKGIVDGKRCKCVSDEYAAFLAIGGINPYFTFERSRHSKENDAVYDYCESYTQGRSEKPNILLIGRGGTGKTYLSNAIGGALTMKGEEVIYYTAFDLNNFFLKMHLSRLEDRYLLWESVITAQYLIIDDLGTEEPHKVTLSSLYNLINQRNVFGKNTVVTSNLHPEKILALYGERIMGRLTDKNITFIASLSGSNLRHSITAKGDASV